MPKYLVLFNSTKSATELMADATPEQLRESMAEWMKWQQKASKKITFEWGTPLQAAAEITANKISGSKNPASGYCIVEGDKDIVFRLLQAHPHLSRQGGRIEMLEMLSMPGI